MPSVNAEFFGLLLGALQKAFGGRMVSQKAYDDLIERAFWVEHVYAELPPDPNEEDDDEPEVCPECGQEVDP